jgi:DNA-binding NarL/FixJ family response regulator
MTLASELLLTYHYPRATLQGALIAGSTAAVIDAQGRFGNDVQRESSAARCWDELVEGRVEIVGHATSETHASLVVSTQTRRPPVPCNAGDAALLQRVLSGEAQKVLALDLNCAPSTVSQRITLILSAFGLRVASRRVPLALVMVAASRAIGSTFSPPGYQEIACPKTGHLELQMLRPETVFCHSLSTAEYEVIQAVVEGRPHKQIGACRDRSPRTVANQLRSIADKLGVCGRFQYINRAIGLSKGLDLGN